ncbi:MAG: undecaprenyl-diphosphate phosphatase [Candidatus Gastranaerophilaceae bacterium]
MNLIQAILMGIVHGLSEFLPISSSAHLVFTSNFYKVFKGIEIVQHSNEEVFFDIMVHLGTLVAVLIFFRKDITNILKAMWHLLKQRLVK